MVQFYDSHAIEGAQWPADQDGGQARKFLVPFIKNGPRMYIENVQTELIALHIDEHILPVSVSENQTENCYVCSPVSFYGGFSKEKVSNMQNRVLKSCLSPLVSSFHKGLQRGNLDKIAYVNNWLLSTNIHPNLTDRQLVSIRNALIEKYPDHTIGFRSINRIDSDQCYRALEKAGFHLVATRPVYFVDTREKDHFKSRMFKSDHKILKNTDYEILDNHHVQDCDISRIIEIYRMLYVDKYSSLNPKLTDRFIELVIRDNILDLKILKKDNRVDGVLGYFCRNNVITSPLFGYDTTLPKDLGLYRMISTLMSLEARERGVLLNMSAGAGKYKTLRRAKPCVEYNAFYTKHLSFKRRLPWMILGGMMNKVGSPIMFKLDR
jgi:hypothetical protein